MVNLGRAQAAQGRTAEALKSAEEAERLFERGGDARGRALAEQARKRLGQPLLPGAQAKSRARWAWLLIVLGLLLVLAVIVVLYLLQSEP